MQALAEHLKLALGTTAMARSSYSREAVAHGTSLAEASQLQELLFAKILNEKREREDAVGAATQGGSVSRGWFGWVRDLFVPRALVSTPDTSTQTIAAHEADTLARGPVPFPGTVSRRSNSVCEPAAARGVPSPDAQASCVSPASASGDVRVHDAITGGRASNKKSGRRGAVSRGAK